MQFVNYLDEDRTRVCRKVTAGIGYICVQRNRTALRKREAGSHYHSQRKNE